MNIQALAVISSTIVADLIACGSRTVSHLLFYLCSLFPADGAAFFHTLEFCHWTVLVNNRYIKGL
jgi:hypothetical protein